MFDANNTLGRMLSEAMQSKGLMSAASGFPANDKLLRPTGMMQQVSAQMQQLVPGGPRRGTSVMPQTNTLANVNLRVTQIPPLGMAPDAMASLVQLLRMLG